MTVFMSPPIQIGSLLQNEKKWHKTKKTAQVKRRYLDVHEMLEKFRLAKEVGIPLHSVRNLRENMIKNQHASSKLGKYLGLIHCLPLHLHLPLAHLLLLLVYCLSSATCFFFFPADVLSAT